MRYFWYCNFGEQTKAEKTYWSVNTKPLPDHLIRHTKNQQEYYQYFSRKRLIIAYSNANQIFFALLNTL